MKGEHALSLRDSAFSDATAIETDYHGRVFGPALLGEGASDLGVLTLGNTYNTDTASTGDHDGNAMVLGPNWSTPWPGFGR